jgi:hypothetical protein
MWKEAKLWYYPSTYLERLKNIIKTRSQGSHLTALHLQNIRQKRHRLIRLGCSHTMR